MLPPPASRQRPGKSGPDNFMASLPMTRGERKFVELNLKSHDDLEIRVEFAAPKVIVLPCVGS